MLQVKLYLNSQHHLFFNAFLTRHYVNSCSLNFKVISADATSSSFATFLSVSITISCIPKQIPKHGTLLTLQQFIAKILPKTPLFPKPPGIKTQSQPLNLLCKSLKQLKFRELNQIHSTSNYIYNQQPKLNLHKLSFSVTKNNFSQIFNRWFL